MRSHAAIEGVSHGQIINLTDRRAANSRNAQLDLLKSLGPDGITKEAGTLIRAPKKVSPQPVLPHLVMPTHHDVRPRDVVMRRLHGSLAAAANCGPCDFAELLLVPGVGARTVKALALVAEVVHGAPCRFSDPARFSLAHGGKDRHPFPVPLRVYDETIRTLKTAVQNARLGREEELGALKRLDQQARQLEVWAKAPSFEAVLAEERQASPAYGGRSVFGWERDTGLRQRSKGS
jgi:hypothetical protein